MAKQTTATEEKQRAKLVCSPGARVFYESQHNTHRIITPVGTQTAELEDPNFCSGVRDKVSGGDLVFVFTDDWRQFWMCLAVGGGGQDVLSSASVQLIALPNYPVSLPVTNAGAGLDLPEGYRIEFDQGERHFVAMWGDVKLGDGSRDRENARRQVLHHARVSAQQP